MFSVCRRQVKIPLLAWLVLMLTFATGALVYFQDPGYHPILHVRTNAGVDLVYLHEVKENRESCERTLIRLERSARQYCKDCPMVSADCQSDLSPGYQSYLGDGILEYPSAHMARGVMVFRSEDRGIALQTCQHAVDALRTQGVDKRASCYPAGAERPYFRESPGWIDMRNLGFAILAMILAQLVSKFSTFLVIRYEHLHAHLSHDHIESGPQKFHALPTPRVGGIPIFMGILFSALLLQGLPNQFSDAEFGLLVLAAAPAFLGGVTEDVTKRVGVSQRLLLTMLSGLFGCFLSGAVLTRVGVPGLDTLLGWLPFAFLFTAFAVGGVANSINIIDGYNGLASGFGIIASLLMAVVAMRYGDTFLVFANFVMVGALMGFFVWNYPGGRIFLGDGGAYLLGFWLAEMAILLLVRNPGVSVWYPLAVMIYPVFETLYSIYRRRFKHKQSPGQPDAAHLHQLVYKRLVRVHVGTTDPEKKVVRNSRVAPYFWLPAGLLGLIATISPGNTYVAQLVCLTFCTFYCVAYNRLLGWRIPRLWKINR